MATSSNFMRRRAAVCIPRANFHFVRFLASFPTQPTADVASAWPRSLYPVIPEEDENMRPYLRSWRIRVGVILLVLGTGPLVSIMVAARLGFTDDPNPNPVLFGMLAGLTFWPSVALIAFGAWRIRKALRAT